MTAKGSNYYSDPYRYGARKHQQGRLGTASCQLASTRKLLPQALLNAATTYDAAQAKGPEPTGFVSVEGNMGSVRKIRCERCGEPRRHDALVEGVCRYKPKCDDALRDSC